MKDLNEKELKVLVGLCDEFITESDWDNKNFPRSGWAGTSFDNAVGQTGLSMSTVKGYVGKLVQKGYVKREKHNGDEYLTLTEKCDEVIEYKGDYTWGVK